jgi:hypothetical protein
MSASDGPNVWRNLGWSFGVLGPIVCLVADPIVFRGGDPLDGRPLLKPIALVAYLVTAICVPIFASVLRSSAVGPARRGALFAGAVASSLAALVVTPVAMLGPLFLAAAVRSPTLPPEMAKLMLFPLGFVPLGTAIVFWHAFERAPAHPSRGSALRRRLIGVTAALATLAVPIAAQRLASHAASAAMSHFVAAPRTPGARDLAVLRALEFTTDLDPLLRAYTSSGSAEDREAFATTYQALTGGDIQLAANRAAD